MFNCFPKWLHLTFPPAVYPDSTSSSPPQQHLYSQAFYLYFVLFFSKFLPFDSRVANTPCSHATQRLSASVAVRPIRGPPRALGGSGDCFSACLALSPGPLLLCFVSHIPQTSAVTRHFSFCDWLISLFLCCIHTVASGTPRPFRRLRLCTQCAGAPPLPHPFTHRWTLGPHPSFGSQSF